MIETENDKNAQIKLEVQKQLGGDGVELEEGLEEGAIRFFTDKDYNKQEEYDKVLKNYSFLDFKALDKLNELSSKQN